MKHRRDAGLTFQNVEQMARICDEVRESGYASEIAVVANGGALPKELYEASFIVASTNLASILDINTLNSGSIVVDYSPPRYRSHSSLRRKKREDGLRKSHRDRIHPLPRKSLGE